MKQDNTGKKNIKGDNSREIIICVGRGVYSISWII